jgi:hypothetical protein
MYENTLAHYGPINDIFTEDLMIVLALHQMDTWRDLQHWNDNPPFYHSYCIWRIHFLMAKNVFLDEVFWRMFFDQEMYIEMSFEMPLVF